MSNFRNHVQLIGNAGEDPKITPLDGGRKVARFPMGTNEHNTTHFFILTFTLAFF